MALLLSPLPEVRGKGLGSGGWVGLTRAPRCGQSPFPLSAGLSSGLGSGPSSGDRQAHMGVPGMG